MTGGFLGLFWFFSPPRPLQSSDEPGWDGADAQTLHGLGSGELAGICQIPPEFPSRKRGCAELPAAGTAGFCSLQTQTNSAKDENTPEGSAQAVCGQMPGEFQGKNLCPSHRSAPTPGRGVRGRIWGGGQPGGVFSSLEGFFFQLPCRLLLREQHGKELPCTQDRQGGIFFLSRHPWEAAGSHPEVEFTSWQRARKEKS